MKKNRRMLGVAIALGLLLTLMTGAALAAETWDEIRARFPDGMYWNHAGMATDNSDSCTDMPCPIHTAADGTEYYTTCNIYTEGSEATRAFGFARRVAFGLYGAIPTLGEWETQDGAVSNGWTQKAWIDTLDTLTAGDMLQFRAGSLNETAIVCDVDANAVTLLEANADDHCRISWTRKLTLSELQTQVQHVWQHPDALLAGDTFGGAGADAGEITARGASASMSVASFSTTLSASGVLRMTAQWSGGAAPYQVNISLYNESTGVRVNDYTTSTRAAYATTAVSNLPAGSYRAMVVIQDADGYATSASRRSIAISGGQQPVSQLRIGGVTLSTQSIQTGGTATARVSVSGGVSPYTYGFDVRVSTAAAKDESYVSFGAASAQTYRFDRAGTFVIRAYVRDAQGATAAQDSAPIYVTAPVSPLYVSRVSLNRTSVTAPASVTATISAAGGTAPYTYALYVIRASDGSIADTVSFRTGSQIAYTFYNTGTYYLRGVVRDATGAEADAQSSLVRVNAEPLALTSAKLSDTYVNTSTTVKLRLTANGGVPDYEYGAVIYYEGTKTIYTRVSYRSSSTVSFRISDPGVYTVRGRVRDAEGTEAYRYVSATLTVIYHPMEITGVSLASTGIFEGASSKVTIAVSYGTPDYKYGLRIYDENGGLYKKVALGSSKAVKYAIADKGVYDIEAVVQDAAGQEVTRFASKRVTVTEPLKVGGPGVLPIDSAPGDTWTLKAMTSGGKAPYTFKYSIYKDKKQVKSFTTTEQETTCKNPGEGLYTVYLTVTDAAGNTKKSTSSTLFVFDQLKLYSVKWKVISTDGHQSPVAGDKLRFTISSGGGYRTVTYHYTVQKLNESTGKYENITKSGWINKQTFDYRTKDGGTYRCVVQVKDSRKTQLKLVGDPISVP